MSETRRVQYTDSDGRRWVTRIPANALDDEAPRGIPVGPPPLDELDLPKDVQTRLHNQLVDRGILTAADIRRAGSAQIVNALQAALAVDAAKLTALFSASAGGS